MKTNSLLIIVATALLGACQQREKNSSEKIPPLPVFTSASAQNPYYSKTDTTSLMVSDSTWQTILPDSIYQVARKKGTERAFTGKYWNYAGLGTYYCAVCGNKLFRSDSKFESDCGWPSFFETSRKNSVFYQPDLSYGMDRIEVLCGRCKSHLGHLFDDGPPPTGKRYCMNSVILDFDPDIKTRLE